MKLLNAIKTYPIKFAEIETIHSAATKLYNSHYFRIKYMLFRNARNRLFNSDKFSAMKAMKLAKAQIKLENEVYDVAIAYVNNIIGGK